MKIILEISISNFDAWSGAVHTQRRIIDENMESEFDDLIEDLYPDGLTDTQLNDILWFEEEWIYDNLGITDEEEEEMPDFDSWTATELYEYLVDNYEIDDEDENGSFEDWKNRRDELLDLAWQHHTENN